MPAIKEFYLDPRDGVANFEYDDGTTKAVSLDQPSATGGAIVRRQATALRKIGGSQQGLVNGFSSSNLWGKLKAPGKFSAVRVWVMSRGFREAAGYAAAVAPTDASGYSSLADAFLPRKGGTSYPISASNTNPYGWRVASWGGTRPYTGPSNATPSVMASGNSGVIYPSAAMRSSWDAVRSDHAVSSFVASDWIEVPPLVAGDGNYYVLVKIRKNGSIGAAGESSGGGAFDFSTAAATSQASSGSLVAVPAAKLPAGDFISDSTLQPTGNYVSGTDAWTTVPFFVEFMMDENEKEVRSFAFVGESHFEGYLYPTTAFANVQPSVPDTILNYSNFGMSSNRSSEYFGNFDNYLKAGLGVTDVVMHTLSTNDGAVARVGAGVDAWHEMSASYEQIRRRCDELRLVGIRPWIVLIWYGQGTSNPVPNPSVQAYWDRIKQYATAQKIPLVDLATDWQYNSTWLPDSTHAGAPGIAYWNTQFEAVLRAELGV